MRIDLDTPQGRMLTRVEGGWGLRAALDLLLGAALADVRSGKVPPLYDSGVRYRREPARTLGRSERWQRPARTLAAGCGDCEDLATWRAAELLARGEPAWPVLQRRRRGYHVIVRTARGDEDPSMALGMIPIRPALNLRRVNGGYAADVTLPLADGIHALRRTATAPTGGCAVLGAVSGLAPTGRCAVFGAEEVGIAAAAAAVAAPYIKAAAQAVYNEVKGWFTGASYEPSRDFFANTARNNGLTAVTEGGLANQNTANAAQLLAAGVLAIYCTDSESTRNNYLKEWGALGWPGRGWWQRYSRGWGRYTHWYGAVFRLDALPANLRPVMPSDRDAALRNAVRLSLDGRQAAASGKSWPDLLAIGAAGLLAAQPAAEAVVPTPTPAAEATTPARTSARLATMLSAPGARAAELIRDTATAAVRDEWDAIRAIQARLGGRDARLIGALATALARAR